MSMKKILIASLLLLPLVSFAWGNYSDGSRAGELVKLSHKGLFWKTWEGQMNLGGMIQGDNGAVANVWQFSLDNNASHGEDIAALSQEISDALDSGKRVKLFYHQEFIVGWWRAETEYLIYKVEILK